MNLATSISTVWLNGSLIPAENAAVSPFDHGLLTGDGVFETLVTVGREPFAFSRHFERLKHSASRFGLNVPEREDLLKAIRETVAANAHLDDRMRIRVTVTGGEAPLGSEQGEACETTIVAVGGMPGHGDVGHAVTVPYPRNEHGATAGLKTTSYGENVIALADAKKQGGSEAIFGNIAGNLCEGTGSNIFIARRGMLITPPLSAGCLAGVTRAIVLELCEQEGIDVKLVDTPLSELPEVDEAFLTSTLRDVQPLATIDGKDIPWPGKFATRLREAFKQLQADPARLDP